MLRDKMLSLSLRIKHEREVRGWDVLELVIRSGVNQATIYNIESGAENITLKSLIAISNAFGMESFENLFTAQKSPSETFGS